MKEDRERRRKEKKEEEEEENKEKLRREGGVKKEQKENNKLCDKIIFYSFFKVINCKIKIKLVIDEILKF